MVWKTIHRQENDDLLLQSSVFKSRLQRTHPGTQARIEENAGIAIPSFCAAIRITDNDKVDARYLTAFLNSSYVRDELTAKVVGSARPMIKITDIRALEVPELNMKDMQDIGKAFVLSGLKKATLQEMIDNETKLMENVVLASIREGIGNED